MLHRSEMRGAVQGPRPRPGAAACLSRGPGGLLPLSSLPRPSLPHPHPRPVVSPSPGSKAGTLASSFPTFAFPLRPPPSSLPRLGASVTEMSAFEDPKLSPRSAFCRPEVLLAVSHDAFTDPGLGMRQLSRVTRWDYEQRGGWVTGEPQRGSRNSLTGRARLRSLRQKGKEVPGPGEGAL